MEGNHEPCHYEYRQVRTQGCAASDEGIFNIPVDIENLGVQRESCDNPKIQTSPEEYAAVIKLKHETVKGSGFVIVKVPKKNLIPLMKKSGFTEVSDAEATDACGELCNLIAGSFKVEMNEMGRGLIGIGVPLKYPNGADFPIEGVIVHTKYVIAVPYNDEILLTVEVAFGGADALH